MSLLPRVPMPSVRLLYHVWQTHHVPKAQLDAVLNLDFAKDGAKKMGINIQQLARLHEVAASTTNDPAMGAKVGRFLAHADTHLGELLSCSETLAMGYATLKVHADLLNIGGRLSTLEKDGWVQVQICPIDESHFSNQQHDVAYSILWHWVSSALSENIEVLSQIKFRTFHSEDKIQPVMSSAFVECHPSVGLWIPVSLWRMSLRPPQESQGLWHSDTRLRQIQNLNAYHIERMEMYALVQDAIRLCLMEKMANQEQIAKHLGLSVRNLQRRLKKMGTNYQNILDDVRHDLALKLIINAKIPLYEIAYLIGYTEPSAFYKAFKRWTGKRPGDFRAALMDEGTDRYVG